MMKRFLLLSVLLALWLPASAHAAQTFYKSITLAESQSGTADSTDFPLTFRGDSFLADTANGGKCVVGNSGFDVRFYADSSLLSTLSFERVYWTNTTGAGEWHVRIPTLSVTADTVIYVACGDTALTADGSSVGTWNAAFQNVYHLGNTSALILTDSTSNARTLTNNGTTFTATGQIGGAAALVGASSQYLVTGAYSIASTTVTMEAWVYSTNFVQQGVMVNKKDIIQDWEMFFSADTTTYVRGANFTNPVESLTTPSNSNWHHMVGTITGTTGRLYIDGVQDATSTVDATANSTSVLNLGRFTTEAGWYFTGTLDEVRISNVERSPSWITATWNNQKASSTFTTMGTLTAAPGGGGGALALTPAAQTPHFPHITIFDYARMLFLNPPGATDYEWYADHLDAIEVHGHGATVRGYNPTSEMFSYWFDMSNLQSADFTGLAESGFLHFSEDTTMNFWNLARTQIVGTANITGCPGAVNSGCRVQTYVWDSPRYIFDPQSTDFRTWHAAKVLGSTNVYGQGVDTSVRVWLDEHAPGLSWPLSFGYQGVIETGGAVKEFGNRRPWKLGVQDDTFEADYGQALADWLAVLRTSATAAGKKVLINSGPELFHPAFNTTLLAQANAIQGIATESMHRPDGFASPTIYSQWVTQVQSILSAGGIVDLSTTWCNSGPAGYTAGNYTSAAARFRMWRLASYYQFKEPVGSTGKVYFNAGFCSNNNPFAGGAVATDQANWALAYQVDVGVPSAAMVVHQTGSAGGCSYTIYRRNYTNATIYVRPNDGAACTNYGDSSAATVALVPDAALLNEDSTTTALVSSFSIRNAEAVIVMSGTGEPPAPAAPTNLRLVGGGGQQVFIWTAAAGLADFAGYKVYRSSTSGGTATMVKNISLASAAAEHHSLTQYIPREPVAGTSYYTVTAYNTLGEESAPTDEVALAAAGVAARAARIPTP